ncbi:tail fiber protein [Shigella phage vB_SsoS_008]|nr:tail fiber protein [Shigella phage vB_SsoS_008]
MKKENGKRKAEYTKSLKLIADETEARVTAVEQLRASFGDQISASNSELREVIATETGALSREIDQLKAQIGDDIQASLTDIREVIATETEALSREIDQLKAQIGDDIQASLTDIREAIANETEARTQADLSLSARLGNNEAALSQKLDSWSNADSTGAMYGVKLGLKYNGQEYSAGMAMSLIGSGAAVKAQILFEASRFAIMHTGMNGQTQYPFVVENGQVILSSAIIKDGFITNAMIGNWIQSNNWVFNHGWRLNKGGDASFMNATVTLEHANNVEGAFKQTNNTVSVTITVSRSTYLTGCEWSPESGNRKGPIGPFF